MPEQFEFMVGLLGQVPLVGIFVWFVLEMLKRQAKIDERRDAQWRVFLAEQGERQNTGLARIAEEVKKNTARVSANTQVVESLKMWMSGSGSGNED